MVKNNSLSVFAGQITGVFGLVGAGRTETFKVVAGILKRDFFHGGEVLLHDRPVRYRVPAPAVRAGIAYVTEDRKVEGFFETMSVSRNIYLGLLAKLPGGRFFLSRREADKVGKSWVDKLKIRSTGNDIKVVELSGGNQQKVVIAKSLAQDPDLIIFDERTRGVDVGAIVEIRDNDSNVPENGFAHLRSRLFDFRRRRSCRKHTLECCKVCGGQVRNRNIGEIRIAPASNIISCDGLVRDGLAGSQRRHADGMCGMLVDDRRHWIVVDDIHASPQQREALRGEVWHLGRFRQARREPGLHRMAVGRRNIERLRGQQTPDMTRNDLAGNILALIEVSDRHHDGTGDHCAKHRCRGQRLKRPASLTQSPGPTRTLRIQGRLDAGSQSRRYVGLRKRTKRLPQRHQSGVLSSQKLVVRQPALERSRGSQIKLAVAIGVQLQVVVVCHGCNHIYFRFPRRAIRSCRPRDRRDITVPIGTLVISAISR